MHRRLLLCSMMTLPLGTHAWAEQPRWQLLPPTPTLPKLERSGYVPVNGIRVWYAVFGHGKPVIFLHGGLANAN